MRGGTVLDRFVEAGGNLIDTSNNYVFRVPGATGDESETTVGRRPASRGGRAKGPDEPQVQGAGGLFAPFEEGAPGGVGTRVAHAPDAAYSPLQSSPYCFFASSERR
ncbi:hypothetical protein ACWFRQ_22510 [Streptomyces niveus]